MDERIAKIEKQVDVILNNHLPHLSDAVNTVDINLAKITVEVGWLVRFFWIVATASTGSLIAAILGLLISK